MNFQIKKQLTNTRPPKSTVAELVTAPTKGIIKISDSAATAMKIASEDYIALYLVDIDGTDTIVAFKGGKDDNGTLGSKVAGSNGKNTGTLQFSSANVWQMLEGNEDVKSHWSVDIENPIENEGTTYFKLELTHTSDKMSRGGDEDEVEEED